MQNQNPNPTQEQWLNQVRQILEHHEGINSRLNAIFAWYYEKIQQEIEWSVRNLPQESQTLIIDHLVDYMEESMNWPSFESNEEFLNSILL